MGASEQCVHCGAALVIKHHTNKRYCNPQCRLRWHVNRSNAKRHGKISERYHLARKHGLSAKESARCRSDAGYARLLERIESEQRETRSGEVGVSDGQVQGIGIQPQCLDGTLGERI